MDWWNVQDDLTHMVLCCWLYGLNCLPHSLSPSSRLELLPHTRVSGQCPKTERLQLQVLRPRFWNSHRTFSWSMQVISPVQIQKMEKWESQNHTEGDVYRSRKLLVHLAIFANSLFFFFLLKRAIQWQRGCAILLSME